MFWARALLQRASENRISKDVSSLSLSNGGDRFNLWNARVFPSGIRIFVRIMGLLLVALAVPFFINGLTDLGLSATSA